MRHTRRIARMGFILAASLIAVLPALAQRWEFGAGAAGTFYFDVAPITMVTNKAQRMLKLKPRDFATGLKETYRWYLRNAVKRKRIDYSFEDSLLELAQAV